MHGKCLECCLLACTDVFQDRSVLLLQICQSTSQSKQLGRFEDEDMRSRSRVLRSMQYPYFDERSRQQISNAD